MVAILRTAKAVLVGPAQKNLLFARAFSSSRTAFNVDKVYPSAFEAIKDIKSDSTLLCGGFGLCGVPNTLINAVRDSPSITGLIAVSNNAGVDGGGLGQLLETGQVKKMIASYVGENKTFERKYLSGEIDLELTPQGTLAERLRAGGAGIPAFYTPAAFGTWIQTGELPVRYNPDGTVALKSAPREVREFDGRGFLLEEAIKGDVAFVRAYKADKHGNAQFRLAAHNFNGAMGRNAKMTIVEAEHIVEPGEIDPEKVHLPGIYVSRVIQASSEPKGIEKLTLARDPSEDISKVGGKREKIVARAAKEFKNGMYANLGIGLPTLIPGLLPADVSVTLQSENGILGLGPYPVKGKEDADLINAGKETVTLNPGASLFGSEESFGMIRAGKVDLTVLGAMQVSQYGDLANWAAPNRIKGMGGAMDLVANPKATKVVVVMEHCDKKGRSKIMKDVNYPITGVRCVSTIITDLAVFDVDFDNGLVLKEFAEGVTIDEIKEKTDAPFRVADDVKQMDVAH